MARIDLEKEFLDNRKRKKRARILGFVSSSLITGFVIISYLGYSVGQNMANATSISLLDKSEEIGLTEIGFRVPTQITPPDQVKYGLKSDDYRVDGVGYVYWTSTTVTGQTIRFIVDHAGYSTSNSVQPATSRRFQKGDKIEIYKEPDIPGIYPVVPQVKLAETSSYIGFDILFRVTRKQSETNYIAVPDYGIYFSRDIQFYGEVPLLESLRFGFMSNLTSDIVNPGRTVKGSTAVGGRLDLDGDGYFDSTLEGARFDSSDANGYKYEAAYGDFITTLTTDNWGPVAPADIAENSGEPVSHYNAKTEEGVRPLLDYTPALAMYEPFNTYQVENPEGIPLALTDQKGIAEVAFRIWLEGWDVSAGDKLKDKTFGANLRFTASELNTKPNEE